MSQSCPYWRVAMCAFIHSECPQIVETVVTCFSVRTAASFWGVLRFLVVAFGLGLNIDYFPAAAASDQLSLIFNLWLKFSGIFCKISSVLCMVVLCGVGGSAMCAFCFSFHSDKK